jgi:hypothetical protein
MAAPEVAAREETIQMAYQFKMELLEPQIPAAAVAVVLVRVICQLPQPAALAALVSLSSR